MARLLHERSLRCNKPFVAVTARVPRDADRGGAVRLRARGFHGGLRKREGRFRAADGGTLFLDEIAELPPSAQAKLLRVLQDGTVEPLVRTFP